MTEPAVKAVVEIEAALSRPVKDAAFATRPPLTNVVREHRYRSQQS